MKNRAARKSLTWNLQEPRLKNHLGSRLNFNSPLKGCRSLCDDLFKFHVGCFGVQFGFGLGLHWVPCQFWSVFIKKVSCMISRGTKSTGDPTIGSCQGTSGIACSSMLDLGSVMIYQTQGCPIFSTSRYTQLLAPYPAIGDDSGIDLIDGLPQYIADEKTTPKKYAVCLLKLGRFGYSDYHTELQ